MCLAWYLTNDDTDTVAIKARQCFGSLKYLNMYDSKKDPGCPLLHVRTRTLILPSIPSYRSYCKTNPSPISISIRTAIGKVIKAE